jgi:prepilin-type N-terminal cleavage/methylation domain-containing protein
MSTTRSGFTLMELAIVMVIVALIVAGILLGQDLIFAAKVRKQMTQIEKYNTAISTFRTKYNGIPGDLVYTAADAFGFVTRSGDEGHGDGNRVITNCEPQTVPIGPIGCEEILFWSDLSAAELIPESFTLATDYAPNIITFPDAPGYFPLAKIVDNAIVAITTDSSYSMNWFVISQLVFAADVGALAQDMIPVFSAYTLDAKMDDALPNSGTVIVKTQGGPSADFFFMNPLDDATSCVFNAAYNMNSGDPTIMCQLNFRMTAVN